MAFVGRRRELEDLGRHLDWVREGRGDARGRAVLLRGRRRVGTSRLVEEFIERVALVSAVRASTLAHHEDVDDVVPRSWTAALGVLAAALPDDGPSVVVLDELPWILEGERGAAGELQRVWDRRLAKKPVLLLLLGSDLGAMEQLSGYDQPFHQRAVEMQLHPLNPAEIAEMTGLGAADALDAFLVTGGLPLVAREWRHGESVDDHLASAFASATSALVVTGTQVLDAEFPPEGFARQVLTAVGGRGERTFTGIQRAAPNRTMTATTLTTALDLLVGRGVPAADVPLSTRPAAKDRRLRIADPFLRFWLAFVEPALNEVDRGRPDLAMARVRAGLGSWRGRAVEPVVRQALERLLPDERFPDTRHVGGWWPHQRPGAGPRRRGPVPRRP